MRYTGSVLRRHSPIFASYSDAVNTRHAALSSGLNMVAASFSIRAASASGAAPCKSITYLTADLPVILSPGPVAPREGLPQLANIFRDWTARPRAVQRFARRAWQRQRNAMVMAQGASEPSVMASGFFGYPDYVIYIQTACCGAGYLR